MKHIKVSDRIQTTVNHIVLILFSLSCLIPFLLVISVSFSNELDIMDFGYKLIPQNFDLTAYKFILKNPETLLTGYKITIIITLLTTVLGVFMMALCAYPLSRRNFVFRRQLSFYLFFTMLFSGGLIPSYILVANYLHMSDTIWAMVIPSLVNAFHIIIIRTFFQKLPDSIFESAKIDGASEFTIFFRIVLRLSGPVLATISLLTVLGKWNDFFSPLLYIQDKSLFPLQYMLQKMMMDIQFIQDNMRILPANVVDEVFDLPNESIRMAMCIMAAGPMLVVFPFFQKYFVRGLTVGSVKG